MKCLHLPSGRALSDITHHALERLSAVLERTHAAVPEPIVCKRLGLSLRPSDKNKPANTGNFEMKSAVFTPQPQAEFKTQNRVEKAFSSRTRSMTEPLVHASSLPSLQPAAMNTPVTASSIDCFLSNKWPV